MSPTKTKSRFQHQSPYDKANVFSRVCFAFLVPLFLRGLRNNGLEWDDLPQCSADDEATRVMRRLKRNWEQDKAKRNPNFAWTLLRTFGTQYVAPFAMFTFEELVLSLAQPLLLSRLIRYFSEDASISYLEAVLCGMGVCLCNLLFVLFDHPTLLVLLRNGMRIRTACCSVIYQKALRLSRASVGQTQVGQIINIMSNDMSRLDDFSINSIYLLLAPVQSAIIIYITWLYLGPSCFAGVGILLLYIPLQSLLGRLFGKVRQGIATLTDTRLRYMNEIISGIRVIKMYTWERPFAKRVAEARKAEVAKIRKSSYLKAINLATFFVASRFILFVCFVVYVLLGNTLTSEAVFVVMSLMNLARLTMTLFFPQAIGYGAELRESFYLKSIRHQPTTTAIISKQSTVKKVLGFIEN